MKKLLIISAFALMAGTTAANAGQTGLASIHELGYERGRMCMSGHVHDGTGNGASRRTAELQAMSSWASFVDLEYGSDWAHHSIAGGRTMKCSPSGGQWSCATTARPCLAGRVVRTSRTMRSHSVQRVARQASN